MTKARKHKFFYGYTVVGSGFLISLLMWGAFDSFGIFFKPLSSDLGWTRATTSGAFSLAFLLFGVFSILVGRLTDRFGPKVVLATCGLLLGSGYLLMSQVSNVWQFYLFYGVIIGAGLSGAETPILATVARWFVKRRGVVTGITKTGAGIGIVVVPFVASWIISGYGWRTAYVIFGIVSIIGVISAALLVKRDPGQIGQLPDGAVEVEETDSDIDFPQYSLREVIGSRQFWLVSAAWLLLIFCVQTVIAHIAPHVTDLGVSVTVAASVLSVIGGASIIGRLGMGGISDRLGNKPTFIITILFLATSLVIILFAREMWMFYLFATLYGISHGALFTLMSPMLAELFGLRSIGAVIGTVVCIGTVGGALGPVLAGSIFDITRSYQPAFLICLAFSIVAIILVSLVSSGNSRTGDRSLVA